MSGSCGEGLLCIGAHLNAPDGYCTQPCSPDDKDGGCDETSFCAREPGYLCLKLCTTNKDCRKGYECTAPPYDADKYKTCHVANPR